MNNKIYINGICAVSAQRTYDNSHFLEEIISHESNQLKCADPNYKELIPGDMVRRMSRIIKMGVAASRLCLQDAGCALPDAIITGTGLGCIEDTEKFLTTLIRNKEEFLTPTSFIQSTHNTVSAQIALLLRCHGYNFTYCHRGISFETALLDSIIRLHSGDASTILLGGADELTPNAFRIMQRLGFWKIKPVNNLKLLEDQNRGTIAGEGASFFLLSTARNNETYAEVVDVDIFLDPENDEEIQDHVESLLERNELTPAKIGFLMLGLNGDPKSDKIYHQTRKSLFQENTAGYFKHLCGEYHTASAFALWLAAMIFKKTLIPDLLLLENRRKDIPENILIYNHYRNINHSLILVKKA